TLTAFLPQDFKSCVSTDSTTSASRALYGAPGLRWPSRARPMAMAHGCLQQQVERRCVEEVPEEMGADGAARNPRQAAQLQVDCPEDHRDQEGGAGEQEVARGPMPSDLQYGADAQHGKERRHVTGRTVEARPGCG